MLTKSSTALTRKEQNELDECEGVIGSGLDAWIQVGEALADIREKRLYRQTDATFDDYCDRAWQMRPRRAYDLMANVAVAKSLPSSNGDEAICEISHTESHLRELGKVPVESRKEVAERAVEIAPTNSKGHPAVTAKVIQQAAAEVIGDANDETPVDQIGNKIESKGVQAAFAERGKFTALQRKVSALKAEFAELCDGNAGRYAERQQQQFDAEVGNLHAIIRFSIPHAVCPYCGGRKCDSCKQSGWMSEDLYKAVPGELKGA